MGGHVELARALGAHLRSLRERRGLTVTEVARRMRVDSSRIYAIELKGKDSQMSTVLRYCEAIGARVHIGFPGEAP